LQYLLKTHLHLHTIQVISVPNLLICQTSNPVISAGDHSPDVLLEGSVVRAAFEDILDLGKGAETG
jgi:hypothetical protein